jgi:hypothetical protein
MSQPELRGDLAGILALASGSKKPATGGRDGLQVTLVAGTRNLTYFTPPIRVSLRPPERRTRRAG